MHNLSEDWAFGVRVYPCLFVDGGAFAFCRLCKWASDWHEEDRAIELLYLHLRYKHAGEEERYAVAY